MHGVYKFQAMPTSQLALPQVRIQVLTSHAAAFLTMCVDDLERRASTSWFLVIH